jgi:probable phosphoglycerate mutase
MFFIVYIDGGSRGNPGPAAWGAQVRDEGDAVLAELRGAIGVATNNVAEYTGLVSALEWCRDQGATRVHIKSDSLLLVQQMRGHYKVKHEGLKPLHGRARLIGAGFARLTFEHIPREQNTDADRLANEAMDEAKAVRDADDL